MYYAIFWTIESKFYFWMFWQFLRLITDESIELCKQEIKAHMKANHTSIQKSYTFADPMFIFNESGSKKQKQA